MNKREQTLKNDEKNDKKTMKTDEKERNKQ